jgi:hypothetical protein
MIMAKTTEIQCITKIDRFNPYERITHVGGWQAGGWKITQEQAIRHIENGEWAFYVLVNGVSSWVIVAQSRFGNKYLKTKDDRAEENNLLSLPECP